jgi:hypothetical protein
VGNSHILNIPALYRKYKRKENRSAPVSAGKHFLCCGLPF